MKLALTLSTLLLLASWPLGHAEAAPAQPLSAARELSISGAYQTELSIGERPSLTIEGPSEEVVVESSAARISIGRRGRHNGTIKLIIVMAGLDRLSLSGAQKLEARDLKGQKLELDFSGASTAELSGQVDALHIELSGASRLEAAKLAAKKVDVEASGASRLTVNASESLEISASGASSVRYTGGAKVETEVSGAARVEKL